MPVQILVDAGTLRQRVERIEVVPAMLGGQVRQNGVRFADLNVRTVFDAWNERLRKLGFERGVKARHRVDLDQLVRQLLQLQDPHHCSCRLARAVAVKFQTLLSAEKVNDDERRSQSRRWLRNGGKGSV
jgi:hypothetical protein